MREISDFPKLRRRILTTDTIHILAVGFEDRCLAYPKFLQSSGALKGQVFLAIKVSEDNVTQALVSLSEANEAEMGRLLPAVHIQPQNHILDALRNRPVPTNYVIDTSAMPRYYIHEVLRTIIKRSKGQASIFVTYSYPARFVHGNLQEPAADVSIYYDIPALMPGDKVHAFVMPGFDIDYTNMALGYMTAATGHHPTVRWLFSFPGREYQFYERALETHLEMMEDKKPEFFPQDELNVAVDKLHAIITSIHDNNPVFCVPLGCRLACVPLFLAVWRARMEQQDKSNINVLIPKTRRYSSLRSEGGDIPFIEELRGIDIITPP